MWPVLCAQEAVLRAQVKVPARGYVRARLPQSFGGAQRRRCDPRSRGTPLVGVEGGPPLVGLAVERAPHKHEAPAIIRLTRRKIFMFPSSRSGRSHR